MSVFFLVDIFWRWKNHFPRDSQLIVGRRHVMPFHRSNSNLNIFTVCFSCVNSLTRISRTRARRIKSVYDYVFGDCVYEINGSDISLTHQWYEMDQFFCTLYVHFHGFSRRLLAASSIDQFELARASSHLIRGAKPNLNYCNINEKNLLRLAALSESFSTLNGLTVISVPLWSA